MISASIGGCLALYLPVPGGWLIGAMFATVLLAFAPGAFKAVDALALAINYDPAFIVAHHMVRYFGIILMTPVFLLDLKQRKK